MLNILLKIFGFFSSLWSSLSEEQKNRIIDILVDSFEWVFRKYYAENKKENANG